MEEEGRGMQGASCMWIWAGQGWSGQALCLITVLPSHSTLLLAICCVSGLTPGCVGGESYNHGTT